MTLYAFVPKSRDPRSAQVEMLASCDGVRQAIAEAGSVREAYRIYEHVKALSAELTALVDLAGARCNKLLDDM